MKNFLKSLIGRFSPDVFRPVPEGIFYVLLQTIAREISGECPWDTNGGCQKGYTSYWSRKCRNSLCPGYLHPLGLIAYTSESDVTTGMDNRFDYSSFRFNVTEDWIQIGTLGCRLKFDWGTNADTGGFGANYFGAYFWGDNATPVPTISVHVGDKWYVNCYTSPIVIGTDGNNYKCKRTHEASSTVPVIDPDLYGNRPILGNYATYWEACAFGGLVWEDGKTYIPSSLQGIPAPDPANEGSYGALQIDDTRGLYTGDHDTQYTIELINFWGYVQNFENAVLQICLATSDGEWIDFWGEYFGIPRLWLSTKYESDDVYKARIIEEVIQAKGTKPVILAKAKNFFKSENVDIVEYHQIGGWDGYVEDIADDAYGLYPYQFYVYPPVASVPSAKWVRTGSNLSVVGFGSGQTYTQSSQPPGLGVFTPYSQDSNMFTLVDDCFLFGNPNRFSGLKFIFSTPGVGGTYTWEYWAGSWKTLTIQDKTSGFTADGYINWIVPDDFLAATNIMFTLPDSGGNKFWVRAKATGLPAPVPKANTLNILFTGQTCRGAYVGHTGTYPDPLTSPSRDENNCYIYASDSFEKPDWHDGFQEIVDRVKTAGTVCIINERR